LINDEPELHSLLSVYLTVREFQVTSVGTGSGGLRLAYELRPDLAILDLHLGDADGKQVLRHLREVSEVPIIAISTANDVDTIVETLQMGADDFVTKPFHVEELTARIEALLRRARRTEREPRDMFDDGVLRIEPERLMAWRAGEMIHLTPTEAKLLQTLLRKRGQVVPHEELVAAMWRPGRKDGQRSLALYVRYLREKLEENPRRPKYILTKWGMGYLFAGKPPGVA
jgi:two-component system KDP operon response regulator KdpE